MRRKTGLFILLLLLMGLINVVSTSALSVAVHVPEKYTDIIAGERLYFEVEVKYPENPQRKDLRLSYEVLDNKGELIAQSKVLKAIETQASFMDFIVIPESANNGMHIIKVKIEDYEDLSQEVEASFHVGGAGTGIETYFYILIGFVILVGIIISIEIHKMRRQI